MNASRKVSGSFARAIRLLRRPSLNIRQAATTNARDDTCAAAGRDAGPRHLRAPFDAGTETVHKRAVPRIGGRASAPDIGVFSAMKKLNILGSGVVALAAGHPANAQKSGKISLTPT